MSDSVRALTPEASASCSSVRRAECRWRRSTSAKLGDPVMAALLPDEYVRCQMGQVFPETVSPCSVRASWRREVMSSFPEDLVEVILDGRGGDEEPGGDLRVRRAPGGETGDLCLLRRQVVVGLLRPFTGAFAGGEEFGTRPLREGGGAHGGEQVVRDPQPVAGVPASVPSGAQPLAVEQVGIWRARWRPSYGRGARRTRCRGPRRGRRRPSTRGIWRACPGPTTCRWPTPARTGARGRRTRRPDPGAHARLDEVDRMRLPVPGSSSS